MITYNAIVTFDGPTYRPELIDQIVEHLDSLRWDQSISTDPTGRLQVRATLPAQNLGVASMLANAEIARAVGAEPLSVDITTDQERTKQEPFTITGDGPEPLSVEEVAKILDKTDARVRQMISESKFKTARRIGKGWFIEMEEVRTMLPTQEEINEFDFMGHSLDRLFLQSTEDLVALNTRLNEYADTLPSYPDSAAKLHMDAMLQVWLARLGDELQRRGVMS